MEEDKDKGKTGKVYFNLVCPPDESYISFTSAVYTSNLSRNLEFGIFLLVHKYLDPLRSEIFWVKIVRRLKVWPKYDSKFGKEIRRVDARQTQTHELAMLLTARSRSPWPCLSTLKRNLFSRLTKNT